MGWSDRLLATLLLRFHKHILAVIGAATLASGVLLVTRGLKRDYSLEAFVASKSDSYDLFRRVMDEFVSNELAVIAIESDDIQSPDTLALTERLVTQVRSLDAVERATSWLDVLSMLPSALRGVVGASIRNHPLLVDNLISRDGKVSAIILQMAGERQTGTQRRSTVRALKQIVSKARVAHPNMRIVLAGPYVTLLDMYEYVDRDLLRFSAAAAVLLLVTLGLLFRRIGPVVFSLVVSLSATVCTLGVASALDLPVTLVTQMVVILVMVLSVATCVHLCLSDDEVYRRTPFLDWQVRCRRVLSRMAAPCAAAVVTTAAGFGSVSISSITPVRMFGILMVVGLAFSLVAALVALPVLVRIRPTSLGDTKSEQLPVLLRHLAVSVDDHRGAVFVGFALISALFCVSLTWLGFESDFVKNFRPSSEVRQSYEFIESRLSPTGSIEVVVRANDGGRVLTPNVVARMHEAGERVVATFDAVAKAMTIADLLTAAGGGLPTSSFGLQARMAIARGLFGDDAVRNFVNSDVTALRMNLRVREGISVDEKLAMARSIDSMVSDIVGSGYRTEVTGLYVFYATLVKELWEDQFRSLGLTVPLVFLVLVLVLRSVRAGLVAMVPTALPVLFCLGAMGWTGIAVNMTTAMMLSVTLGIAVDDAVHYLWRFRSALVRSGDHRMALKDAHGGVGRACVFTTVVIAGGFWILVLSEFLPTAYFGGLLGFTMGGALACDLILLPALVMTCRPFARSR